MTLRFLGGAGTVTGSKYLITVNEHQIHRCTVEGRRVNR